MACTTTMELPDELWQQIFDQAADEDVIFSYGLPTNMAECAWYKNAFGEWALRTPQEAINLVQRRSYATKKAIMKTCTTWRRVGSETFFRCLFFSDPQKLRLLSEHLKSFPPPSTSPSSSLASSPGWWTRRLHLARYNASSSGPSSLTEETLSTALTTILSHTPNLQILIIDFPLSPPTFSSFAPYLRTRSSTRPPSSFSPQTTPGHPLHTLSLHLSFEVLPKLIWALDSLPNLVSLHVTFEQPCQETLDREELKLGSAGNLALNLGRLQQLGLKGACGVFLDQAGSWEMPSLRGLTVDLGSMRNPNTATAAAPNNTTENGATTSTASAPSSTSDAGAYPDLIEFLERQAHGLKLLYLDIYSIPPMNVPRILEACPRLETFCFNADWKMDPVPQHANNQLSAITAMALNGTPPTQLTITPHPTIRTIGLHGLSYAFGVGIGAAYAEVEPLRASRVGRSNDANFLAFGSGSTGTGMGKQFPELERVRVLSRVVLRDLEREGGPGDGSPKRDKGKGNENGDEKGKDKQIDLNTGLGLGSGSSHPGTSALQSLGLTDLDLNNFQFEYGLGGGFLGGQGGGQGGGMITGMQRWEKWWDQCSRLGVRLEDCTGEQLGVLPIDEDDDEFEEEEDGDEEEGVDEEEEEEAEVEREALGILEEDSDEYSEEEDEDEYSDEYDDPDAWPSWIPRPPPLPMTPPASTPGSPTKSPLKSPMTLRSRSRSTSPTKLTLGLLSPPGSPTKRSSALGPSPLRPDSPSKKPSTIAVNVAFGTSISSSSSSTSAPASAPTTGTSTSANTKPNTNTNTPSSKAKEWQSNTKLSRANTRELRKLIQECQDMAEGREEMDPAIGALGGMMGMGMGMGMGGMGGMPGLPGFGLPGMGMGMGTGAGPSSSSNPFSANANAPSRKSRRSSGGMSVDMNALGAMVGLPPMGPVPDSPTKERRFGGGFGFGSGSGTDNNRDHGEASSVREAAATFRPTSFQSTTSKPIFGIGGGLDTLGRGSSGYGGYSYDSGNGYGNRSGYGGYGYGNGNGPEYVGEDDEDEDEYTDDEEEEDEVQEMLGDLSIREDGVDEDAGKTQDLGGDGDGDVPESDIRIVVTDD